MFQVKLEFKMLVFVEGGKLDDPDKKPLRAKLQTKNKLNPHVATVVGGKYSHQCTIPGSLSVTMQGFASCFNHHFQIMHLRRWFINSNKDRQTKHLSFNLPFLEHKKLWSIHACHTSSKWQSGRYPHMTNIFSSNSLARDAIDSWCSWLTGWPRRTPLHLPSQEPSIFSKRF